MCYYSNNVVNPIFFMFVRTIKAKHNHYVAIVRAFRDASGKQKQRMVQNLGAFKTEEQKVKLMALGKNLIHCMEGKPLFSADELLEVKREQWGAKVVVDKLFERFKLEKTLALC